MQAVGFRRLRSRSDDEGQPGQEGHDAWGLLAKSKPTMPCKTKAGISDEEYEKLEALRKPFKLPTSFKPYAQSSGPLCPREMRGFRSAGEACH